MFKLIRNMIGTSRGYSCCPNCGDSWVWKSSKILEYNDRTGGGVLLCTECLTHPVKLKPNQITKKLTALGWESRNIDKVRLVITNLKAQRAV